MHPRAVRNGVAREREEGRGGARGGRRRSYSFSWRLGLTCIRVCPQRLACLRSPCTPAPALGRRGAAHPDALVARSACVPISPRVVSYLLTLISLRSSIFILPFPALVLCVCRHLLIATRQSTSSCYASPRVLRIGLGGAGNRRGLARCAGFWSSLELADLFLYLVQFYIAFPSFILYSIPVLSLFLYSSLLPLRPPSIISARVEAGADSRFVIALRVTPVPCTRPRLPWGRTRHVAAYLQYLDIAAARHVVYPRVGAGAV
ncbi:hypothetical protein B0H13DRAFT_1019783 [Mycena leptocephala]|nr:hypothetical protein B0H13DRAFT_1019783 [Mycena leptocephala]